ncbi:rod shape-determining protein RodA [uncultured Roseburia sp.]|uniref:FtsW/RodA/SpoVE family cell cycle protein n=1 Tax=Brotonthovivens ammoniilytica TaxID=2981725 RepID=A0ABT2TN49_9FIRM|nr:FtsW/RodA/SpoVE family cell cycle protein [Brotonthovivens ammoniilytica]MCU6763211.1 FtsW/RodA/SpoVE family cell cycle protein [Brotonthovivens ammoniilytica]SCJ06917.1 rod shape-determining protein RodA [uncultured Roseburia sp.]
MQLDEYLDQVTEQIRCRKVREDVRDEIGKHIQDQKEAFRKRGIDKEAALRMAVIEMGDPVSVGVMLDRIHRPKMDWRMLGIIGSLSLIGMLIQSMFTTKGGGMAALFSERLPVVGLGIVLMILICVADYSFIGRHARKLFWCCTGIVVYLYLFGRSVNGTLGPEQLWMYLYIPLYAAVLFQCRKGVKGIVAGVIYGIIPVAGAVYIGGTVVFINLLFIELVLFSVFIWKQMALKRHRRKRLIFGAWMTVFAVGFLALVSKSYRIARFVTFFQYHNMEGQSSRGQILNILNNSLMAKGSAGAEVPLSNPQADYVITSLIHQKGYLAALLVLGVLTVFFIKTAGIIKEQKNQLGYLMAAGCSLFFVVQTAEYLLMNLGLIPGMFGTLPFLSYGNHTTILMYVLSGVLLSTYRYKDVVTDRQFLASS